LSKLKKEFFNKFGEPLSLENERVNRKYIKTYDTRFEIEEVSQIKLYKWILKFGLVDPFLLILEDLNTTII